MRVRVSGTSPAAAALRGLLSRAEIRVVELLSDLDVVIDAGGSDQIVVDGVDGELERQVVEHICNNAPGVYLARKGGIRSARAIRIIVPPNNELERAVELGCLRGILAYVNQAPWWKIW